MRIKIGIITASDRASAGVYEDISGQAIIDTLNDYLTSTWEPVYRVIPDIQDDIEKAMVELADDEGCCLIVTTGGWESHYSPRGINGPIEDLLFPIHHGILHYPGFDVLPPFLVHRTSRIDRARFDTRREELGKRLDHLWRTEPIAYRKQNGGDYDIPALTLRAEVAPGQVGFGAHVEQP